MGTNTTYSCDLCGKEMEKIECELVFSTPSTTGKEGTSIYDEICHDCRIEFFAFRDAMITKGKNDV